MEYQSIPLAWSTMSNNQPGRELYIWRYYMQCSSCVDCMAEIEPVERDNHVIYIRLDVRGACILLSP